MHMTSHVGGSCLFLRHDVESIENSTVFSILRATTRLTKRFELHFQLPQLFDPKRNVPYVFIQKRVDFAAIFGGGIPETKQNTDFIKGHVQTAAVANERQALSVRFVVDAVVSFRPLGVWQQALALVVANGLHLYTRQIG